jgi:undecaprenyl-diphosphatase
VVEKVIQLLQPLLTPPLGYVIVALATLLENSVGVGVIVPGETIVILGGVYASDVSATPLWLPGVIVAAAAGAVIGDNIGYWIGRRFGRDLLEKHGHRLLISKERLDRADAFYERHGGKTVFLARFVPVVRSVGVILAGISGMPWKRFFLYDLSGAVLWAIANAVLGYLAGRSYERWQQYADRVALIVLAAVVLGIVGSKILSKRRSKKAEAERA